LDLLKKCSLQEVQTAELFVDQTIFLKLNPLQIIFKVRTKLNIPCQIVGPVLKLIHSR
jgi:hypothetical protein